MSEMFLVTLYNLVDFFLLGRKDNKSEEVQKVKVI